MRGMSYTPSPPRGYGRRGRTSPSPRGGRDGGRSADLPTSFLVRNLRHDCSRFKELIFKQKSVNGVIPLFLSTISM
ncbi:unnamed protein product [Brassica oleracea var. botrytis]|uniref:(rape) hypothetical protein n=1 Tax=Brassica napus TaxID=3708 RepID=A0A816UA27_BRANA|nr:unnamed protein product [Brassica napus]